DDRGAGHQDVEDEGQPRVDGGRLGRQRARRRGGAPASAADEDQASYSSRNHAETPLSRSVATTSSRAAPPAGASTTTRASLPARSSLPGPHVLSTASRATSAAPSSPGAVTASTTRLGPRSTARSRRV